MSFELRIYNDQIMGMSIVTSPHKVRKLIRAMKSFTWKRGEYILRMGLWVTPKDCEEQYVVLDTKDLEVDAVCSHDDWYVCEGIDEFPAEQYMSVDQNTLHGMYLAGPSGAMLISDITPSGRWDDVYITYIYVAQRLSEEKHEQTD